MLVTRKPFLCHHIIYFLEKNLMTCDDKSAPKIAPIGTAPFIIDLYTSTSLSLQFKLLNP
jgi:hypothetical protein